MATKLTKLASPKVELAVLRGMCHKDKKVAGKLLANIDDSYFYSEESKEVYQSILRLRRENGDSPSYRLLIEDPEISTDARSHMRDSVSSIQTVEEAERASKLLNKYRQTRGLFNLSAYIAQQLKEAKLDIDGTLQKAATAVNVIRSKKSTDESFLHFGKNNNSLKMVKAILFEDNSEEIIPTGIEAFDEVSGGLSRGSLFTIGATSGGGKSVMASALAVNMASMGYKVLLVPLEMSKREMTARIMANVTKTNLTKILRQQFSGNDKNLLMKRFKRWLTKVNNKGGRYTIFKPDEDMNIEEIMASIAAYDTDVVIIDYISLLKGVDGDDQWLQLGATARYAKINAENNNRVNILLCQVGDDGKVRYARSISEHSSNSWVWTATKESKETGITKIEQPKSRNSLSFPFEVQFDYATMRVLSVNMDERQNLGALKEEKLPNLATQPDV